MATPPKPPGLLVRLPASPPDSPDLTENSFDLSNADDGPEQPRVLGVRELIAMAQADKTKRKNAVPRGLQTQPIALVNDPNQPPSYAQAESSHMAQRGIPSPFASPDPFAKDVVINGWMIVGGKGWGEVVKVGSYVGERHMLGGWCESLTPVYDIEITLQNVRRGSLALNLGQV